MATYTTGEKTQSWIRSISFQSHHGPARDLRDFEIHLLEVCSGRNINEISAESDAYLLHLGSLADGKWTDALDKLIHEDYELLEKPVEKVIQLCSEVAGLLRAYGGISMVKLIQKLQLKKILRESPNLSQDPIIQGLVFSLLGWLSLLYIPANQARSNELRIILQSTKSTIRTSIPEEVVGRPLDEMFRSFGDLLPKKSRRRASTSLTYMQEPAIKFEVSHLNVATLKDMARMKISWVDSLSTHLEFDPTIPSVSLFKCPSFCKIHQSENSTLAVLVAVLSLRYIPQTLKLMISSMLHQFYEEDERPSDDFSIPNLLGEVMLSYILLFRADRRSRRIYQKVERARASLVKLGKHQQPQVDSCLDELCGNNIPSHYFTFGSPVRDSYDSNIDFPIFRDRLKKIQDYMKEIQPNRFMSLWRDQRDLRLWYTIWVVIILSVIGLVIALVSMFLAAVQVNLARLAYDLQLKQNQ